MKIKKIHEELKNHYSEIDYNDYEDLGEALYNLGIIDNLTLCEEVDEIQNELLTFKG